MYVHIMCVVIHIAYITFINIEYIIAKPMTISRHLKLHGIMKFYIIVYSTYVANLKCPLNLQYC